MTLTIKDMTKQLEALFDEAQRFLKEYNDDSAGAGILANRLEAAVTRLSVKGSIYREQLKRGSGYSSRDRLIHDLEVALALGRDLKDGWTETVVELVHADTYSNYLEMAEALLAKGYKDAAAVITGTSLEVHIRALCEKNSVTTAVAGKPKKADTMNADLKKAGVYSGLQQKQIMAWMDLRNKAAHGDYGDYDKDDVRQFIDGVQAFLMKYPA
jgi:uncharacterized protein YutE (UPF0331/DUF86 family)